MARGRWTRGVLVLALAAVAAGCGRKGPPLQPFVRIPAAVEQIAARRVGDDVYVTLTVPSENVDASLPVAVTRIEVYGYTGVTPPSAAQWGALGTLVAEVPVEAPEDGAAATPAAPTGPARPAESLVLRDTLGPGDLVQGPLAPAPPGRALPVAPADDTRPLQRFYTAYAFDARGRPSPAGGVAQFTLQPLPAAPPAVRATYTAGELTLAWTPSGGLLGFLFERGVPPEPPPPGVTARAPAVAPPARTRYNVYLATPGGSGRIEAWRDAPPAPLTPAPVDAASYQEPVRFGVERCFVVRGTHGTAADAPEGPASAPVCVTPEDTFPPAAPGGLAASWTPAGVSLTWAAGAEADLGGYLVLRGAPGALALRPVTPEPVRATQFLDDNVTAGSRYVYAVVAVDRRVPTPNRSVESARVEITAR